MHRSSVSIHDSPKVVLYFFITMFFILAITACQQSDSTPTQTVPDSEVQVNAPTPTKEQFPFKTSEPGTTSVHGMLLVLDPMTLIPAHDDQIYAVPLPDAGISTIPHFEVGTVPQAEVDERTGEFMFTNLLPGDYAVVVITKGGAQIPSRYYQGSGYAIFSITIDQADTVVELGNLSLP